MAINIDVGDGDRVICWVTNKIFDRGARTAVVVEDDADIRGLIEAVLRQAGFEVSSAATGADGVELVHKLAPSVVTLDLGLGDIDGFEVARRIRLFSDCYLVIISAQKEEADLLIGLEAGADDYITKPFRPRELRARIQAMLRRPRASLLLEQTQSITPPRESEPARTRAAGDRATAENESNIVFHHNGLTLNDDTRIVELNDSELGLTRSEFNLLRALLRRKRRVQSKAELVRELRDEEYVTNDYVSAVEERAVEVHFANIRRKLSDDPRSPRWVETVRGVGYRLAPASKESP